MSVSIIQSSKSTVKRWAINKKLYADITGQRGIAGQSLVFEESPMSKLMIVDDDG